MCSESEGCMLDSDEGFLMVLNFCEMVVFDLNTTSGFLTLRWDEGYNVVGGFAQVISGTWMILAEDVSWLVMMNICEIWLWRM